jgi:hypothetical protein
MKESARNWHFRRRVAVLYGLMGVIVTGTARLAESGLGFNLSDLALVLIGAAASALLGLILPRSWIPSNRE